MTPAHVTRADLVGYCMVAMADMREECGRLQEHVRTVRFRGDVESDDYAALAQAVQTSLYAVSNLALMLSDYLEHGQIECSEAKSAR